MINSLYDTLLEINQNTMCCTFNPDTTMNRKAIKEKGLEGGQKNWRKNSMIKVSQTPPPSS